MNRIKPSRFILTLTLSALLISSAGSGVVQASDDDLASTCTGDPTNIEELEDQYEADAVGIGGTINSPANLDIDAIYLETNASLGANHNTFYITIFHTDLGNADNNIAINISSANAVGELENIEWTQEGKLTLSDPSRNASFRLSDDSFEDNICLQISANNPEEVEYDWKFTISQNNENQWYPAPERSISAPGSMPTETITSTATQTPERSTSTPESMPTETVTSTATQTEEEQATPTEMDPSSSTLTVEEEQATTTTSANGPGFGVTVVLVAVPVAILLRRRQ